MQALDHKEARKCRRARCRIAGDEHWLGLRIAAGHLVHDHIKGIALLPRCAALHTQLDALEHDVEPLARESVDNEREGRAHPRDVLEMLGPHVH